MCSDVLLHGLQVEPAPVIARAPCGARTTQDISLAASMVAGACNHPNWLVLPYRLELIRLAA